jgi:hypothetical protein
MSYKAVPAAAELTVSDQQDNEEIAELRQVNADLTKSLGRCRRLLDDCRAKLAANSYDPAVVANDDEDEDGQSGRA